MTQPAQTIKNSLKIAFVQDAMLFQGGADNVMAAALEVFPQAEIFTLVYKSEAYRGTPFERRPIHTSFLDSLPGSHRHHRLYLPLMPLALEAFDLKGFDIVIAFSYAVAHAVHTDHRQLHISYFHTPMRYAWKPELVAQIYPGSRKLPHRPINLFLDLFRRWDSAMSRRSDILLTNSHSTAGLIWQAYRRKADVIYPPVDLDIFKPRSPRENYYMAVSRLIGHKRLDLVVQAFTRLGYPLLVAGEGPEEYNLRAQAGPNVQFLGRLPQGRLADLLGHAKAFVHAGEEDFGIAIAEAQAAGCPAIVLEQGASSEIISHGKTGILFQEQSAAGLAEAVRYFESEGVADPPERMRAGVERFSKDCFKMNFEESVLQSWAARQSSSSIKPEYTTHLLRKII